MKITINTRYNVGDTVYIIDNCEEFYAHRLPYIITDVFINASSRKINVLYDVKQDNFTYRLPENWIFRTYEECKKWCDEHN